MVVIRMPPPQCQRKIYRNGIILQWDYWLSRKGVGRAVKPLRTRQHRVLIEELKRVRKQAGMTQSVLAERLGVAQSFVAKVEAGERRLDVVEFVWWLEAANAFEESPFILARVRVGCEGNS
ncbi:MAG: helix-turn-helix transcriptional regulator [Tabrizicola sp.]|nr:helix-turn-helix transcriptional regulator [Tabrizicola sp.]